MTQPRSDLRSTLRRRVLLPGLIVFGNGIFTLECAIRSLSETGARIVIASDIQLPERFYLINIRDGIAYDAIVSWNKGSDFGTRFESAISLRGSADPNYGRLKELWLAKAVR